MKYPATTAIGDAGEFFFAYQIAHVLGWPCRLFDIDIGLDAQVEILDPARNSLGRFVAFQVKTTTVEKSKTSVYVSQDQVDYWRSLELPVFVALVDLPDGPILLHRVSSKAYPRTKGGRLRIDFDPTQRFAEDSGDVLRLASQEAALNAVNKYLRPIRVWAREMPKTLEKQLDSPDIERIIDLMGERHALKDKLSKAEALAANLGAGTVECLTAKEMLDSALRDLGERMNEWKMDETYDDPQFGNGEIAKFLYELR